MEVVTEDRREPHIDGEVRDEQLQSFDQPLATVIQIPTGERIGAQEKRPPNAAVPDVLDPGFSLADDFFARAGRHRRSSSWKTVPTGRTKVAPL